MGWCRTLTFWTWLTGTDVCIGVLGLLDLGYARSATCVYCVFGDVAGVYS